MTDFLVALGLAMALEGLLYGGFPNLAKRLAADVIGMPEQRLRIIGLVVIASGVALVWFARG